jgi:hypothetical protein
VGATSDPVFADYHRRARRRRAGGVALVLAASAGIVGLAGWWTSGVESTTPASVRVGVERASATDPAPDPAPSAPAAAPAAALAGDPGSTPATAPTPEPAPPSTLAHTSPDAVAITVTASGYQAELDACQWVRMDLGAIAPIVGAHTRCGGSVVLAMQPGDVVDLRGQGLDGTYRVSSTREAHAGDPAGAATAGMAADVLLQTCFPSGDGRVRLVGVTRFG